MQTFLPYPDFTKSAATLDLKRLGKQRVEAKQIFNILTGVNSSRLKHPAVLMWKGYRYALAHYYNNILDEWISRGYRNWMEYLDTPKNIMLPPWLGDNRLHSSHRAALLWKNPKWYGQFDWIEEPKLDYFWPTREGYHVYG